MPTMQELIQFESDIKDLFLDGKIRFPVHLSGGNEQELEAIFGEIHMGDWVFSTHRNHYHALLHGYPPEELKKDIVKYGSMNVYRKKFFTSGIVGGVLPIALGVALSIKMKGGSNHVWVFVGDMAAMTGICKECCQYAHDLPITFVVEDNGMSVDAPTTKVWGEFTPDVRYYSYERTQNHQGAGQWVTF